MRIVAVAALLSAIVLVGAGGQRLLLVFLRGYSYTAAQLSLFVILVVIGLLGCIGSIRLLRRQGGRRITLAYLVLLAAYLYATNFDVLRVVGLAATIAALVALLTPAAKRLPEVEPLPPAEIGS
jgi:hypothetical protein